MYVPKVLAEGKVLYRDIWYLYGPVAPYFNTLLFRVFGVRLTVLYVAGSVAALGSAVFLYLSGTELAFPVAGWCAGAAVISQGFHPTTFCFPVPYSFAAAYGCVVACLFVWLLIRASRSSSSGGWVFVAGLAAAIALLLKLEHGAACYASLGLMVTLRQVRQMNWKRLFRDIIALIPGVALCIVAIVLLVSLRGTDFIVHENLASWPTAYFMKTYGKEWLTVTGFALNGNSLFEAGTNTLVYAATMITAYLVVRDPQGSQKFVIARTALLLAAFAGLCALFFSSPKTFVAALYPPAMTLYL